MPSYEYVAMDKGGRESRGNVVAESASAARRLLRNRNLHATALRPVSEAAQERKWELASIFRGRRQREVLDFTRQLGTMIGAEVKITEAMAVLISQNEDQKLSQILQNIRDQIVAGESLADSLKQYPDWFDSIYVAMIHIGEVTGNLGRSLKLLGDYMGKKQRLEAKVGTVQRCIVDAIDGDLAIARSMADAPEIDGLVQVQDGREAGLRPGEFADIRIMGSDEHDLYGEVEY